MRVKESENIKPLFKIAKTQEQTEVKLNEQKKLIDKLYRKRKKGNREIKCQIQGIS